MSDIQAAKLIQDSHDLPRSNHLPVQSSMVDTDLSVGSGNASEMNDEQLLILASLATLLDYVMAEAHWLYNDKQPEKHTKLPWINVKNLLRRRDSHQHHNFLARYRTE